MLPLMTMVPVGLSPRLRGNPDVDGDALDDEGSIPAPAGEPMATVSGFGDAEVYPRACGGTA